MNQQDHIATSVDGVPIHYNVRGNGPTALVFVHGWCCDRHYWDLVTDHFASNHTVVCLDLAGHGASGRNRTRWTMPAFGQDVVAVIEQLGLRQVVLIGHSMGGFVIVEAARRLGHSVIGLVGADIWQNVQATMTEQQIAEIMAPFRNDFVAAARTFVRSMFIDTSDTVLVERIMTAMSAFPSEIGIDALQECFGHGRLLQEGLQEVEMPKVAINSMLYQTNIDAAHYYGIEVKLMSEVGHFVMMEDPQTFNRLLGEAVEGFFHQHVSTRGQQG